MEALVLERRLDISIITEIKEKKIGQMQMSFQI